MTIKKNIIASVVIALMILLVNGADASMDRTTFNAFLKEFVDQGAVDYGRAKGNTTLLDHYLLTVIETQKEDYDTWPVNEKIAFWINIYNASAIRLVIDHYPIKQHFSVKAVAYPKNSIQQIKNVWDRPLIKVFGEALSLNDIEHAKLRESFNEPRIHFALVCASIGCPSIRGEGYEGASLEAQLDDQARRFMETKSKVNYDVETNTLYLSPIFKWFDEDFSAYKGVIHFVKKYIPDFDAADINKKTKIKWLPYDWGLNEAH